MTPTSTRVCSTCQTEKPLADFVRRKDCVDGYTRQCRACANVIKRASKARRALLPRSEQQLEAARAQKRAAYHRNKDVVRQRRVAAYQATPEAVRKQRRAETYQKNRLAEQAAMRKYREANADALSLARKAYYQRNAELRRAQSRAWYADNKPRGREARQLWAAANPGLVAAYKALRKHKVRRATPVWSDLDAVAVVYELAAQRRLNGDDVHVDHIVPIISEIVCGLHVPHNLQVIPAADNMRKGNRFWPDMPNVPFAHGLC